MLTLKLLEKAEAYVRTVKIKRLMMKCLAVHLLSIVLDKVIHLGKQQHVA